MLDQLPFEILDLISEKDISIFAVLRYVLKPYSKYTSQKHIQIMFKNKFTIIEKKRSMICYRLNGILHRTNGPAVIYANGSEEWLLNGKIHRDNGPALIYKSEYGNKTEAWFLNGVKHRMNGPALIWSDGRKEWWMNGKLHRENGPAIINPNGHKEWWINGKHIKNES